MTTGLREIAIIGCGKLLPLASQRLRESFDLVLLDRPDPTVLTPELAAAVRGVAAFGPVTAGFIDALPKLEIIANFGVGYDSVDAAHAAKRGVMVTNTPDVLTEEVADTTVGLLLNTLREFYRAEDYLRAGRWAKEGPYPYSKGSLRGRTVGIFGMGRIGLAVARRLEAFGVSLAYHNRRPVAGIAYEYHPTLVSLARAVDTLICVAPGGAATFKAIGAPVFEALGPTGVFINIGRGSTVDEAALVKALAAGDIMAAGLDVFADEPNVPQALIDLPNATLLPHVGSASVQTRNGMGNLVVDNLLSWFSEGKPLTPVPETANILRQK